MTATLSVAFRAMCVDMRCVSLAWDKEDVGPAQSIQPKLPRAIVASVGIDDTLLAQIDDAVAGGVDLFQPLSLGIGDARLDIEAGRMIQHEFAGIGVGAHHHDPASLDRAGGKKHLAEQLSGFRLDRQIEHAAFAHDRTPAGEIAKSVLPIRSPLA